MIVARALLLAGIAGVFSSSAYAADQLKFGPAPSWVVQQAVPPAPTTGNDRPVAILLHDQQTRLEPGKIANYSEIAFKIQKPDGLAAGNNLSVEWDPSTDTVTVNKLQIRRGDRTIDVLASGQTFTTMRRETNLDLATLDGRLTATIQPEGLQEGDIVILASTTEHSDPVLKNHVETAFAPWSPLQVVLAHARLSWPSNLALNVRDTGDLATPKQASASGLKSFEVTMHNVEPIIAPRSAPVRFNVSRLGEATDFRSWSDISSLMLPLFQKAAVVPASGPLRDEVEAIRKSSTDPKIRTEKALQLVEQRVRYVALLMGQGGYVPASAESTWSRRFGDCKAKTALLLAILHEFGIEADPVLANPVLGDAIAERLPMVTLFNHVLVRAKVAGKTYWLDGTRTGDTTLDRIESPDYGWGLPLVANASLVRIIPDLPRLPQSERTISIDASAGALAPAQVEMTQLFRGDGAAGVNSAIEQLSSNQRDEALKALARKYFDSLEVSSATATMDKQAGELRLVTKGTAKLKWNDGWYYVPSSSIAYDPDFERAAGPNQQAPFSTDYPDFETVHVAVRMPPGFLTEQRKIPAAVHETVAGVEYSRTATIKDDSLIVDTSERTLVPEISYKEAKAAEGRLKALSDDDVYLNFADNYQPTAVDVKTLAASTPGSSQEFLRRGLIYLDRGDYDKAIADFDQVLKLDPANQWALGDRAMSYAWKKDYADADKDLADLEKRNANHVMLFRTRGFEAEEKGNFDAAAALYSKALDQDPKDGFSLSHRNSIYAQTNQSDKAIADVDASLKKEPGSERLHGMRAALLMNQGKSDQAAAEADILANAKPATAIGLLSAASIYARTGHKSQASAALDRAMTLGKLSGPEQTGRAQVLQSLGRYDEALAATDEAIKDGLINPNLRLMRINMMMKEQRGKVPGEVETMLKEEPDSSFAFVVAGKTYGALGMNEKAMASFDRALAIRPEAYIYVNRGEMRPRTDRVGRLADLDSALKLEPDMPEALTEKAQLLTEQGDYKEAMQLFDRVKPNPSNFDLQAQRGVVLVKVGRTEEAQKLFQSLRQGTNPFLLNNLCWIKAINDILLDSALQECRDSLKLDPTNAAAQDSLGMTLLKLGKLDEALAAYDEAISKRVGASSLMGRAMVYQRKGDKVRAAADAAAARQQDAQIDAKFAGYGLKFDTPPAKAKASGAAKTASIKPE